MRGLNNIVDIENKEINFTINDIELYVPPSRISIHKENLEYSHKALRTNVSTKIVSGSGIYHAQVSALFVQDEILSLHRLIC